jgi:hypothetical protein
VEIVRACTTTNAATATDASADGGTDSRANCSTNRCANISADRIADRLAYGGVNSCADCGTDDCTDRAATDASAALWREGPRPLSLASAAARRAHRGWARRHALRVEVAGVPLVLL